MPLQLQHRPALDNCLPHYHLPFNLLQQHLVEVLLCLFEGDESGLWRDDRGVSYDVEVFDTGIFECLYAGSDTEMDEDIHFFDVFRRQVLGGIKILDGSNNMVYGNCILKKQLCGRCKAIL